MDLNSPTTCSNNGTFPTSISAGAGGVLNGHPVICGGVNGSKCTFIQKDRGSGWNTTITRETIIEKKKAQYLI